MNKLQRFDGVKVATPTGKSKADFWDLFRGNTLNYSQFGRIYLNGVKGTFYKLVGGSFYKHALTPEQQREYTDKYSNVTFFGGGAEYAPEMRFLYMFVADKAIKGAA